jgi:hypothetical protein
VSLSNREFKGRRRHNGTIGVYSKGFVENNLFLWTNSFNFNLLSDPFLPDATGKHLMNYNDPSRKNTTVVAREVIQNGKGSFHAVFPDTTTGSPGPVPNLIFVKGSQ